MTNDFIGTSRLHFALTIYPALVQRDYRRLAYWLDTKIDGHCYLRVIDLTTHAEFVQCNLETSEEGEKILVELRVPLPDFRTPNIFFLD